MLCGWAFLSPLSKQLGWAPGPVSSSSDGARGWILWPALAIMTAESILSVSFLAAQALRPFLARTAERTKSGHLFVRAERDALDSDDDEDDEDDADEDARSVDGLRVGGGAPGADRKVAREDEEPSTPVVVIGAALSCISCVLFVSAVFGEDGIKWWATVIALILASIFAILGCTALLLSHLLPISGGTDKGYCRVRALGTTDLNPVSAIGKISQLVFAVVQPGNVVANLVAGGIAEAGAQQAGDLMQDMKTGYLWGSSPKAQFHGQVRFSARSLFDQSMVF